MPLASAASYSVFKACFLCIVQTEDTWLKCVNMEHWVFIGEEEICLFIVVSYFGLGQDKIFRVLVY